MPTYKLTTNLDQALKFATRQAASLAAITGVKSIIECRGPLDSPYYVITNRNGHYVQAVEVAI